MKPLPFALALLVFAIHTDLLADAPLAPPTDLVRCSKNGRFCASSSPQKHRTIVQRQGKTAALWSIKGWHRWLFVSSDGKTLAVVYDGLNLVPKASTLELNVISIYKNGKAIASIRLADLYTQMNQLLSTTSHLAWVNSITVNESDELILELVNGNQRRFSLTTGRAIQ